MAKPFIEIKFSQETIRRAENDIKADLNKIIKDPRLHAELSEAVIKDIKFQARRGVDGSTGKKFLPLSEEWIKRRKGIAKAMGAHPAYSPRRSNLTLTGELLDSLMLIATRGAKSVIGFVGLHSPYRSKYVEKFTRMVNGKKQTVLTGRSGVRQVSDPIENQKLAEYVQETRPFLSVRPTLIRQLKTIAVNFVRRTFK